MKLTEKINAYNIDCMEFMKDIPDNYYDLAIVDPPYGINFSNKHTGKGWIERNNKDWDKNIPEEFYFKELFRISKNQIIWSGNYFINYLHRSQGWIFWDKGQRNFSLADGELAFTSYNRALRVFDYSRAKMICSRKFDFHPTQKPIALYKWLLKNYAKPGDKIIDTHGGSMSIAIACHYMDFELDICELDKDYFNQAIERFKNETRQLALVI